MSNELPGEVLHALGPPIDWKYEMRREAQQILPSIYLGPYQASIDLASLERNGITDICCIFESREAHLFKPRFPDRFQYLTLDIRDATDQQLISIFPKAKEFIDTALQRNGRVLIHCGDGLSRSPAIMTAYVMASYNVSSEAAFHFVQSRRFCVSPNMGFLHQLDAYEPICQATHSMAQHCQPSSERPSIRRKRSDIEDADSQTSSRPAPGIDVEAQQQLPTWGTNLR
ncbi:hypothetical protein PtA15_5A659 [Puccinia triticina]|uniref:Protein-tyrosine-phosphatase n=1 Tax=Puccinia triticina TaxID=208348 RepID=A0ABY7CMR5_9BASI|nr:uncharacterized protein PtA15_5A659 [Puccinia triticina]WAQ85085.1 hypothetical protein PtA15_5A659 [Puccinia triticina]